MAVSLINSFFLGVPGAGTTDWLMCVASYLMLKITKLKMPDMSLTECQSDHLEFRMST